MRGRANPRHLAVFLVGALAVAVVVAALASRDSPSFQSDVARQLAVRADVVAARLSHGERCAANREADRLRSGAVTAVRERLVAPELAPELLSRTRRLANSITCPPPVAPSPPAPAHHVAPPPPPPAVTARGDEDEDHGKRDDKGDRGRGKKRGHGREDGNSR